MFNYVRRYKQIPPTILLAPMLLFFDAAQVLNQSHVTPWVGAGGPAGFASSATVVGIASCAHSAAHSISRTTDDADTRLPSIAVRLAAYCVSFLCKLSGICIDNIAMPCTLTLMLAQVNTLSVTFALNNLCANPSSPNPNLCWVRSTNPP